MSVKLPPTNECNKLSHLKGVLHREGGGMGRHQYIAQVNIWRDSLCVLIRKCMNELLYDVNEVS